MKTSRAWQTVAWGLFTLAACALGVLGTAWLAGTAAVGLPALACAVLLLVELARVGRSRGRVRLLAILDAYAQREIDRERLTARP